MQLKQEPSTNTSYQNYIPAAILHVNFVSKTSSITKTLYAPHADIPSIPPVGNSASKMEPLRVQHAMENLQLPNDGLFYQQRHRMNRHQDKKLQKIGLPIKHLSGSREMNTYKITLTFRNLKHHHHHRPIHTTIHRCYHLLQWQTSWKLLTT